MQKQGSNSSHEGRKRIHAREEAINKYFKDVREKPVRCERRDGEEE